MKLRNCYIKKMFNNLWINTITSLYSISQSLVISDIIPFSMLEVYQYFGRICQPISSNYVALHPRRPSTQFSALIDSNVSHTFKAPNIMLSLTEVENILHRMTHPSGMMDCNDKWCCSDCISSCLHGADFLLRGW